MKRGVLELTKGEFDALTARFDVRRFVGTTIANKVVAAVNSMPTDTVRIELSEEELEVLMDEVSMPLSQDSMETVSLRKKMVDLMAKFRSVI